jgi:outer membrane protein
MKKYIPLVIALGSLLSAAALAQTPTPPPRASVPPPATAASTGGTGAEGKIAVIVTAVFPEKILELKARLDALKVEFEPQYKAFQSLNEQLDKIKNQLQTQRNTLSATALAQLNEQGADLEKRIKRMQEDIQGMEAKRGDEAIGPIRDKISEFIDKYAAARGITLVIEGYKAQQDGLLLYAAQATNITEDFINEYNKANPVAAPAAATAPVKK